MQKPELELAYVRPVVNAFRGHHNNSTYVTIAEGSVPITLTKKPDEPIDGLWDYDIDFDLINKGKTDIKIRAFYIDVISVDALESIAHYTPFAGIGEARNFSCRFEGRPGRYPCLFSRADQCVFLRPGEHETIHLTVNTKDEGKYSLRVTGEWSTVAGIKIERVGDVRELRILSHSRIVDLPH